jgi:hydrogenase expression/formation protein HypD
MSAEAWQLLEQIHQSTTRPWTLMEVCGGQTHALLRHGIDQLLPPEITLIHGPGCPVCVTAIERIDQALELAERPEVILCSYGDMLRVPGSGASALDGSDDLLGVRAAGGDVRLLTSPLQALALAREHPQREVVFLAVGFETTAPATALLARQALALGVPNLTLLGAHVRVVPAMEAILADPAVGVQGFLAAGHVCAVTGLAELEVLVARRQVPVVVSGFAPQEILAALVACVRRLEAGEPVVANAYGHVVRHDGNPEARALLEEVFMPVDRPWRGFGTVAGGGLALRTPYDQLDACRRFALPDPAATPEPATACIAAAVLQGRATPADCPAFGTTCTPERPLGAPMVSSEGACAAWYRYRRR